MPDEMIRQSIVDEEHLKLLSLCYVISAAASGFFSLFGLMYMVMGIAMGTIISHAPASTNAIQVPPAFVGWIFGGIGFAVFLVLILLAAAKLRTAFCIKQRKSRTFCMVIAGISCLEIPYGTVLGVLTLIVLGRDSVMRMFNLGGAPQ